MAQTKTLWNKSFIQLFIIEIALQMGNYLSRPEMSNYALQLGASLTFAGLIISLSMFTAMLLRPVSGFFADRISKKVNLLVSTAAFTAAAFGIALAGSPEIMAVFCAVQGIAFSFKSISVVSLTALCVPENRVGSAVGIIGLINVVAMALAPVAGTFIAELWGYEICFLSAGIICAVGMALALLFKAPPGSEGLARAQKQEDVGDSQATAQPAKNNPHGSRILHAIRQFFYLPALPLALAALFIVWPQASLTSLILTVTDMGYLESGALYFTAYAAAAMITRPLAGRLSDTLGTKLGIPCLIIAAVGAGLLIPLHQAWTVMVAGVLLGIGQASAQCAVQAESVRGVDADHLGRAANTFYTGMDLGAAAGPFVSMLFLEASPTALFVSLTASCVMGAVVILVSYGLRRQAAHPRTVAAQNNPDQEEHCVQHE